MKRIASVGLLAVGLSGCGTFQLSSGAVPLVAKTETEMRLDSLTCKDEASMESKSAGNQTRSFLLGATIVGAPLGVELEKKVQREAYAKCMTARGYRVIPIGDDGTQLPLSTLTASLPPGWASMPVSPADKTRGVVIHGVDAVNDLHAFVAFSPKAVEPSAEAMLDKRSASIAANLDGASRAPLQALQIGAHKAFRTTVTGTLKGGATQLAYAVSVIDGQAESAYVVAWSTPAGFAAHQATLESVSHRVTGLK